MQGNNLSLSTSNGGALGLRLNSRQAYNTWTSQESEDLDQSVITLVRLRLDPVFTYYVYRKKMEAETISRLCVRLGVFCGDNDDVLIK
jgi:hypothetical protein